MAVALNMRCQIGTRKIRHSRRSPLIARQKTPEYGAAFIEEVIHRVFAPRAADQRLAQEIQLEAAAKLGGKKRILGIALLNGGDAGGA